MGGETNQTTVLTGDALTEVFQGVGLEEKDSPQLGQRKGVKEEGVGGIGGECS